MIKQISIPVIAVAAALAMAQAPALADTETLRPEAAGDKTQLSTSGCTNNYECVDEVTPDEDTTYVYSNPDQFETDLYNLPAHSGSGTINFIKVYARCKEDGAELYIRIKTGGTVYDAPEEYLTTDYVTYSNQWNTNPKTGVAWTWDDIDALQIGMALQGYPTPRCTQVYGEVDYIPAAAPVPTVQIKGGMTIEGGVTIE